MRLDCFKNQLQGLASVDDVVNDKKALGLDVEGDERLRTFDELGAGFETVVLIVVVLDANRLDEADVEHV